MKYDVQNWFDDVSKNTIEKFQFNEPRKIMFSYTAKDMELFKNNIDIYGISTNGMAQVLKRIPKFGLWRHPAIIS